MDERHLSGIEVLAFDFAGLDDVLTLAEIRTLLSASVKGEAGCPDPSSARTIRNRQPVAASLPGRPCKNKLEASSPIDPPHHAAGGGFL